MTKPKTQRSEKMSEQAPHGIYIYQPKPPQADGRIYAIGGLPIGTRCEGLTRAEATAIAAALDTLDTLGLRKAQS